MTRYLVKTSFISLSVSNMNQYFFFLFLLHFFRSIKFSAYFSKQNETKRTTQRPHNTQKKCAATFLCLCYSELIVKSVAKFNLIRLFYPNERVAIALTNLLQSMQNNVHKYRTGTLSLFIWHTHTHTQRQQKKKPIRRRQKNLVKERTIKTANFLCRDCIMNSTTQDLIIKLNQFVVSIDSINENLYKRRWKKRINMLWVKQKKWDILLTVILTKDWNMGRQSICCINNWLERTEGIKKLNPKYVKKSNQWHIVRPATFIFSFTDCKAIGAKIWVDPWI